MSVLRDGVDSARKRRGAAIDRGVWETITTYLQTPNGFAALIANFVVLYNAYQDSKYGPMYSRPQNFLVPRGGREERDTNRFCNTGAAFAVIIIN